MKNTNIFLILAFVSIAVFTVVYSFDFEAQSGDKEFDKRLNEINKNALSNISQFKRCILTTYHANESELSQLLVELEPAEVLLTYEIADLTSLTHAEVLNVFMTNKHKGLQKTLGILGIKHESAQFQNLAKINYDTTIENNSVISRK